MERPTFGFIGTGNMGGALYRAARQSVEAEQLFLANRSPAKAEALAHELGGTLLSVREIAAKCQYIFLGVKPQTLPELMQEIVPALTARQDRFVLVSMAAGVSIARLRQLCNGEYPVIRICPNTPVGVGRGLVVWCADGVTPAETETLLSAMQCSGTWDECTESLMDAASVVGGCTPAFAYMFIEALADGGVRSGLPRKKALLYAAKAVEGAAYLAQQGEHPGALKDAVCSPGGSTIVGVNTLEEHAFRAAAMDAVCAAVEKTTQMGRK